MNILINCSNLKKGGALQVADSVCQLLNRFPEFNFFVVLSDQLSRTATIIKKYQNVSVLNYNITNHPLTLFLGRDSFLDDLVSDKNIDVVLTIFGPSRWSPRVPHVSGFARSHLVLSDSPFFEQFGIFERLKLSVHNVLLSFFFQRKTQYFYTENSFISSRLAKKFKKAHIETITNYYNQVFDDPKKWIATDIPEFNGLDLLIVSANYPHKNIPICLEIVKKAKSIQKEIRFILTIDEKDFPSVPAELKNNFLFLGAVSIEQCPYLYSICDIVFQPSLLECFTATYAEAMIMKKPIITTDLGFAHSLCGNAALYYSPLSADSALKAITHLSEDPQLVSTLITNGSKQLRNFDDYQKRATKLIRYCELVAKKEIISV